MRRARDIAKLTLCRQSAVRSYRSEHPSALVGRAARPLLARAAGAHIRAHNSGGASSTKRRLITVAGAAGLVLGCAVLAEAQVQTTQMPTFEVGLGYQLLRSGEICVDEDEDDCIDGQTFPLGFAIDGIRNFGPIGILAEVGWSRDSEDFLDTVLDDDFSFSTNLLHYGAGVRWTGRANARVWPYAQVLLAGITERLEIDFEDDLLGDEFGESETTTRFMLQPGVGATFVPGDGWGVFGQVDYRRIFLDEDEDGASGRNDVRVFLGLRVILD